MYFNIYRCQTGEKEKQKNEVKYSLFTWNTIDKKEKQGK